MRVVKLKRLMVNRNIPDLLRPSQQSSGIFSNASLDLPFAERKVLTDAISGKNLITFTRTSSGTYVGSDGVLQRATTNLLLRSEEFDNASWSKTGLLAFGSGSIVDAAIAPNGSVTADKITENTLTSTHSVTQNYTGPINLTAYTFSFYAKNAGRTALSVWFRGANSANRYEIGFNLATGATRGGALQGNFTSGSGSITNVGDDWYRCTVTATPAAGETSLIGVVYINENTSTSIGNASYTGDGTSGIYLWGAQLEQSSTVGEYIPTTSTINSAPRFDHSPTTGESLGLLVEEQRTNLLLYSACDSNWVTGGFGTATYNLGLSALGVFSGVQIASAGQNWHSIYRTGISLTASTVYAFTLFYRAGTSGRMRLTFRNNTTTTETLVNGSVGNLSVTAAFAGAATIISQYLCSDGLTYVVTGTFTPNSTSADHWYRIGPDSTTSGQTVIALGGQLEAGAFPTSYIPTTTATATRSADVASITGTNFSSWYSQSEGTVFADATIANTGSNRFIVGASDATVNEEVALYWNTVFNSLVTDGATSQANSFGGTVTAGSRALHSFAYKANDFQGYGNAVALSADTSGTLPTADRLTIGSRVNSTFWTNGTIRRLTYWPARLANSTLQQITQ